MTFYELAEGHEPYSNLERSEANNAFWKNRKPPTKRLNTFAKSARSFYGDATRIKPDRRWRPRPTAKKLANYKFIKSVDPNVFSTLQPSVIAAIQAKTLESRNRERQENADEGNKNS